MDEGSFCEIIFTLEIKKSIKVVYYVTSCVSYCKCIPRVHCDQFTYSCEGTLKRNGKFTNTERQNLLILDDEKLVE